MPKTPQLFNARMNQANAQSWICYQQLHGYRPSTELIPLTLSNSIMAPEQSKSPPIISTPHLTSLPKQLDRYLDEPFSHEKSIELDRWLAYFAAEFEGVRV